MEEKDEHPEDSNYDKFLENYRKFQVELQTWIESRDAYSMVVGNKYLDMMVHVSKIRADVVPESINNIFYGPIVDAYIERLILFKIYGRAIHSLNLIDQTNERTKHLQKELDALKKQVKRLSKK